MRRLSKGHPFQLPCPGARYATNQGLSNRFHVSGFFGEEKSPGDRELRVMVMVHDVPLHNLLLTLTSYACSRFDSNHKSFPLVYESS